MLALLASLIIWTFGLLGMERRERELELTHFSLNFSRRSHDPSLTRFALLQELSNRVHIAKHEVQSDDGPNECVWNRN